MLLPFLASVLKIRIPRWIFLLNPGSLNLPGVAVPVFHEDEREVPEEFSLSKPEEPEPARTAAAAAAPLATCGTPKIQTERPSASAPELGRTPPRVVSVDPLRPAQSNRG